MKSNPDVENDKDIGGYQRGRTIVVIDDKTLSVRLMI